MLRDILTEWRRGGNFGLPQVWFRGRILRKPGRAREYQLRMGRRRHGVASAAGPESARWLRISLFYLCAAWYKNLRQGLEQPDA